MKKQLFFLLFCFLCSPAAFATIHKVTVANFQFTPASLSFPLGDTIEWDWVDGGHTTTSQAIPAGAASWNNPMDASHLTFTYTPTVLGVYNYWCAIHTTLMMASFTVTEPTSIPTIPTANKFLEIIPNPAITQIQIKTNILQPEVGVYDCTGKLVRQQTFAGTGEFYLNIADIPTGLYIVRISSIDGNCQQRLLIAH